MVCYATFYMQHMCNLTSFSHDEAAHDGELLRWLFSWYTVIQVSKIPELIDGGQKIS